MSRPYILCLSASLRNARHGAGSAALVRDLEAISDRPALESYLREQSKLRVQDFLEAGRREQKPFNIIYRNLQRRRSDQGLSNSELALAAAMWGALRQGIEVRHCGLSLHFPAHGGQQRLNELLAQIANADGLLISGPVYFGDRGSLTQALVDQLRQRPELRKSLESKIYAGISVGAKRNGGQETTLIYQMSDLCELGYLCVGNDTETTSQYGGTCVAGDVGTLVDDDYGLGTAIGTGRRIANMVGIRRASHRHRLRRKLRVAIWLLQDRDGQARDAIEGQLARYANPKVEFDLIDLSQRPTRRCIACDLCPTHTADDHEYRCVIRNHDDLFVQEHRHLIEADAIFVAALVPRTNLGLNSVHQRFMERSRYLRRGDYQLADRVVAPWLVEEVGARDHLRLRIMTSMIRHNTLMHRGIVDHRLGETSIDPSTVTRDLDSFVAAARSQTVARLLRAQTQEAPERSDYNPVGYLLSRARDAETSVRSAKQQAMGLRHARLRGAAAHELELIDDEQEQEPELDVRS